MVDFEPDPSGWDEVSYQSPGTVAAAERRKASVTVLDGSTLFLGVQEIPESAVSKWWGKVEFNPSRWLDAEGWQLARAEDVGRVVGLVERQARKLLTPAEPRTDWRVKRMDVARDFEEVHDVSGLLRALAPVPRPWARRNFVHADPRRHGAQTLSVGSGAGMVRAYDKAAETVGAAPNGTLRWEAECRRRWAMDYGGVDRVGHITSTSVQTLARNRWEWSGMGVEVATSAAQLVEHVRQSTLTPREQTTFIGWLFQQAAGDAWVPGSEHTLAKFRRVQRELGIAMPADFVGDGAGVLRRLDFESGREVVRVA